MATDRQFTHPFYGRQARVELRGREVSLTLVATSEMQAEDMANYLLEQMRNGSVNITMLGEPTSIEEVTP